ncbi:hypothetical protein LCGC14_0586400 [marine sediment metagenome]|uniref:Uncharacterized protein n=1 Tax=marine sediment metagenome TaxID=412755 RepID=A0A0F9RJW1_9ZZZZ
MNNLTQEIIDYMTNGWSNWERKHLWEEFKEDEIKDEYPMIYTLIKNVKELDKP